ncbi:MAG: hypothetical protein COX43_01795 [Parcubacteria group bacterium CG23_combo_of_CG06-09_8_20_14_all_35_9]|nr:MAG: hypothetical protein COX43_01795 [Parcubacteria group bacterium CG23_combo_of_CG06-09_8_20_14_all_35_9]
MGIFSSSFFLTSSSSSPFKIPLNLPFSKGETFSSSSFSSSPSGLISSSLNLPFSKGETFSSSSFLTSSSSSPFAKGGLRGIFSSPFTKGRNFYFTTKLISFPATKIVFTTFLF